MFWVVIVIVVLIGGWTVYAPALKARAREQQLRRQYLRQLRVPEREGQEIVNRQLERLQQRHPGQTTVWYLEKMLYELERDH